VTPAYGGGQLYVGSADGSIRAVRVGTSRDPDLVLSWQRSVEGEIRGITVVDELVYVAAGDRVLTFDAGDGRPGHAYLMGSTVSNAAALSDGRIYLAGLGGTVRCMSLI
jgi:outer membrane protein assembly factor BamB